MEVQATCIDLLNLASQFRNCLRTYSADNAPVDTNHMDGRWSMFKQ